MLRIITALGALLAGLAPAFAQQSSAPTASEWWRSGVCYEVFVRSFYDSDGDGVGDLPGLIEKLDYVNDGDPDAPGDLGATCIWLMPVATSPSYHGYDVTNHYRVDPDYGTNDDFERLVAEAHRRGIRVLVDMVLNHSSSEHPFFKHAALHPDSPYRDWYLFLPEHPGVTSPWGGDNWHRSPMRDEYYYGLFWSGMPDLNYETPAVREEAKRVATFWLREMGADGFRLDAIKHLVEADQGRRVEHLPGTHDFLREYAAHIRSVATDAFTIGEVWDSTGALLAYYPDQLDAHFAFEVSDAILQAVRTASAQALFSAVERLERSVPGGRWSPFLRNHDQTRTLTELGGDVARARLAATLLLTLPGLPFIYYGEEIGMTGSKPDPRLRTPMHWSREPAAGFTTGVPWEPLQPDSFTANVQAQDGDPTSLLNHYRRLVHLRTSYAALAGGDFIPLAASAGTAAAYLRREGDQTLLVLLNLGDQRLARVSLSSAEAVLPPGRYAARSLLGGRAPEAPPGLPDGTIRDWTPLPALESFEAHIVELTRRP